MLVLSQIQKDPVRSKQLPSLLRSSAYSTKQQLHEDVARLKRTSQQMQLNRHEVWAVINEVLGEIK